MPKYRIYGPFELPRTRAGFVDGTAESRNKFWKEIEKQFPGLGSAKGCYLFCTGTNEKIRPWYVGKTNGASGFAGEVFQHHKLTLYHQTLEEYKSKPKAGLILVVRTTPTDRLASSIPPAELDWLEKLMIGSALRRNDKLKNKKDTKLLREMLVPGLIGSTGIGSSGSKPVQALRRCLK